MPTDAETIILRANPANPDGQLLGASITDPIGFYGKTPVAQRATGHNTAITSGSSATAVATVLSEIQTTLINLGLMPAT